MHRSVAHTEASQRRYLGSANHYTTDTVLAMYCNVSMIQSTV
jgi:hypothetical protein